jgi:hypothetical protein
MYFSLSTEGAARQEQRVSTPGFQDSLEAMHQRHR